MEHDCKLRIVSTRPKGENEGLAFEITYANGDSEDLLLAHLEGNLFRLEESSLLEEVFYGDTIEMELTGDKTGRFQRVVSRSGLKVQHRLISKQIQDSPRLQLLLDRILQLGGNWERAFGGVLFVHLPQSVDLSLDEELHAIHHQP